MSNAALQAALALANQEAEESGIDMNEAVKGGGGARLLPVGYAFAQLVEYIELGKQPQEFGGKAKDPAMEVSLGFALTGAGYSNEDGTPYIMRPYSIALSRNEKSGAFKLFKVLNYKGTAKNFGQLLGEKFLVQIKHVPKSKADPTLVSRMDLASFIPPLDPVSRTPYAIPDAPEDMFRIFLWNRPTKETFDSLHIEGQYDDGKSKNRIQETMLGAVDFQGSPLQALLGGGLAVPASPALPSVAAPATPAAPVVVAPAVAAPVVPAATPTVAAAPAVPAIPALPALPA